MLHRAQRTRLALLIATAAAAAAIGLVLLGTDALERPELATVDARFKLRGEARAPDDVVVVGIDDEALKAIGTFPFPRRLHAQVISELKRAGARAIAYDVQFTESSGRPADDRALVEAIRNAGNVVLGTTEVDDRGGTNVLGSEANRRRARPLVGDASLEPDAGGTVRRFPLNLQGLESFAVVAAKAGGADPPDRSAFDDGGAWIDYAGPPRTIPRFSFAEVLDGFVSPNRFKGKTVVVGATAPSLRDVQPTSAGGGQMPGPEIFANAIATARREYPLRSAPGWLSVLLVLVAAVAPPAASLRLSILRSLLVVLVAAAAYAIAAQLAFGAGRILPVVVPGVTLLLAAIGSLLAYYLTEARARRRMRTVFARFVPEPVVEDALDCADDDLRLGGVRRQGTVLFCDLRGFTAAVETLEAERVIELLNRYLGEMSEAILDHGGTLVSYMGDGIMAVFGAPLVQEDHAERGVAAAREMAGPRLEAFNAWARVQGITDDGFRMGIGLCSGPVMSGNVGSERRLEYTAVGDTTNTAARLEGMTKDTAHSVFIADATRAGLSDASALAEVGELTVRGRQGALRVWTLADQRPRDRR